MIINVTKTIKGSSTSKKGRGNENITTGLKPLNISPSDLTEIISFIHNFNSADDRSYIIRASTAE